MKESVKLIMLSTCALTGCFVLTGTASVKVLPEVPGTPTPSVPGELLSNASFEGQATGVGNQSPAHPDGWTMFTSGRSDLIVLSEAVARSGNQAARFEAQAVPSFYQGLSQAVQVTRGGIYQFSAYVRSEPTRPLQGTVIGQLSIEWYDANDNEIGSRQWGTTWGASLSSKEWTKVEVSGVAPVNSARAHFVIVEKGGAQPVGGCVFFVDDASVKRESEQ